MRVKNERSPKDTQISPVAKPSAMLSSKFWLCNRQFRRSGLLEMQGSVLVFRSALAKIGENASRARYAAGNARAASCHLLVGSGADAAIAVGRADGFHGITKGIKPAV